MTSYLDLEKLANLVRSKRGFRGLRETAAEIGIGFATLSRVERGKTPDIKTLLAICDWLEAPLPTVKNDFKNLSIRMPNQLTLTLKKNGEASSLEMRVDGSPKTVSAIYDALYDLFKRLEAEGEAAITGEEEYPAKI